MFNEGAKFDILIQSKIRYWYSNVGTCWVLNNRTTGTIFFIVFGMTRSWTGDWTRDLSHSKPALYH